MKLEDSEFVLAVMPFVDVLQPPLGPSVLCGALRSHGLKMKAVYPAMTLAEHIPYDLYSWFGAGVILRFGDYFFSNQVFGTDINLAFNYRSRLHDVWRKHTKGNEFHFLGADAIVKIYGRTFVDWFTRELQLKREADKRDKSRKGDK